MIALDWPPKATLRYLWTGGDRLRRCPSRQLPFQFINVYGPTENTIASTTALVPSKGSSETPSVGRPIDNTWVRIVDRNLEPVPQGVAGELLVGGRGLATSYWNRPALTSEKFVTLADGERAYRTGDFCRFRRDGEVEFLHRIDTQVKVLGYRVELGEIESALLAHDAVRDAVVDLREFAGEKRIVAYVVSGTPAPTTEALRAFVAERLPSYMTPAYFVRIDAVPKTPNGKIDRKKLPSPAVADSSAETRIEPRTSTETQIAAIWKDLLGADAVGVRDDFFNLGGHSLLATRLALAFREQFGLDLPLARMMSAPTVEALADYVDGAARG